MNHGTITGGIAHAATEAWTAGLQRKVLFTLARTGEDGQTAFWKCEVTAPALMELCLREAQPGAGVTLDYSLEARPFVRRGIRGEIRYLAVTSAVFATAKTEGRPAGAGAALAAEEAAS